MQEWLFDDKYGFKQTNDSFSQLPMYSFILVWNSCIHYILFITFRKNTRLDFFIKKCNFSSKMCMAISGWKFSIKSTLLFYFLHKIAQKLTHETVALQLETNVGTIMVYFSGVASTSAKHITGLFPLITWLKLNV